MKSLKLYRFDELPFCYQNAISFTIYLKDFINCIIYYILMDLDFFLSSHAIDKFTNEIPSNIFD
jgi:hypothetical protein